MWLQQKKGVDVFWGGKSSQVDVLKKTLKKKQTFGQASLYDSCIVTTYDLSQATLHTTQVASKKMAVTYWRSRTKKGMKQNAKQKERLELLFGGSGWLFEANLCSKPSTNSHHWQH